MPNQTSKTLTTSAWFVIPAVLLLAGFSANAENMWFDECLLAYGINAALALCCGCTYVWWWMKTGAATDVYRWVTVLFFALTWSKLCALYARHLYLHGDGLAYKDYMDSILWTTRTLPESIVLLYMVVLVADRLHNKS